MSSLPRDSGLSASRRPRGQDASVGDFFIESEIGQGSFATVYLGMHKETKGIVAVKSVDLKKLSKKLKENLYGEIKILKTLRHPHIVALHDCVETPNTINLIMEYCELGDLSHFIKKREKLSAHPVTRDMARKYPSTPNAGLHEVVIRHFLKQIASAMEFLRNGNYIHRDIKPQNLLLLPSPAHRQAHAHPIIMASQDSMVPIAGLASMPMLKLADFGFARHLPSTSLADTLCGSPLYMAPEILRYEKYDAKADLWSIGTVLYEMTTGRPPNKARNHVELLRKIEAAQDVIRFPSETVASSGLKSLIRGLLKRQPAPRLSFEAFFNHPVVVEDIPGLVEDDIPAPAEEQPAPQQPAVDVPEKPIERSLSRRSLAQMQRIRSTDQLKDLPGTSPMSRSPRDRGLPSPRQSPVEAARFGGRPSLDGLPRHTYSQVPQPHDAADHGLGIRPKPHATNTAPMRLPRSSDTDLRRPHRTSDADLRLPPGGSLGRATGHRARPSRPEDTAAQEVADMRDYVVIEKKQVEINAFADEIDANRRLPSHGQSLPSSGPIAIRQKTHHRASSSGAGVLGGSSSQSPRSQALVGREGSGSPGSASSKITKAISDASFRLFGYYRPGSTRPKGQSPPQMYNNPFTGYPSPPQPIGLLGDFRSSASSSMMADEDSRCVKAIEDLATLSDVVYGFAEVKFKQVFPSTPSGLGALGHRGDGLDGDGYVGDDDDDYDLTVDAIVSISEEAFVLYYKVLTVLAGAMDQANSWWLARKRAADNSSRDAAVHQALVQRVNSVVQWIRTRFNEVLEKSEMVQLKLVDAQNRLPDTHPSHPSNHGAPTTPQLAPGEKSPAHVAGVAVITTGVTAEKLIYDRALDMSRSAAIREISHNDLPGCEISYVTAIRMLEAVIDDEGDARKRPDEASASLDGEDKQAVKALIGMISSRLTTVRKKMWEIAEAEKSQQALQMAARRRSGDVTPRSAPTS
jgi:serine/threonine-protein kinase ULK/ATG1